MQTIKHILARYSAFLWALLKPLGAWGVLAIAAVDGSLWGMPVDAVVAGYVYNNRQLAWLYVLMASAGSVLGSLVIYVIGYKGGEMLVGKRIPQAKFDRIRRYFDRHEFLALMLPAILPPPTPFKLFVLSAAIFEMRLGHFMLAIFLGRLVRFAILSGLVLMFGPQIVSWTGNLVKNHLLATGLFFAGAILLWQVVKRRRRAALRTAEE